MGFLSGLLGGGTQRKSSQQSTTQNSTQNMTRAPYAPAVPGLEALGGAATDILNQPLSFYGDTYTPMNATQTGALQGQLANAQNVMPGLVNPALGAYQQTLNATDLASNPYYQGASNALAQQAQQGLDLNIMPAIRTGTTMAGQEGGSSRDAIARGVAGGLASQGLSNAQAGLALGAYNSGLQQQQFGLNYAPTALNLSQAPYQAQFGVGSMYQAQDDLARQGAQAAHYYNQDAPYTQAQRAASLLYPLGQLGGTSEGTSTGTSEGTTATESKSPGMSPLQAILGVGTTLMGMPGVGGALGGLGTAASAVGSALGGLSGLGGMGTEMQVPQGTGGFDMPRSLLPPTLNPNYGPYGYGMYPGN